MLVKKTENIKKFYSFPKLYREDLEKIETILKQELGSEQCKFSTSDFSCDSISEIDPEVYSTSNDLWIQSADCTICVSIDKYTATVLSSQNDAKHRGVLGDIADNILRHSQRRYLKLISAPGRWIAIISVALVGFILGYLVLPPSVSFLPRLLMQFIVQFVLLIVLVWLFYMIPISPPVIFQYKKNLPSFWKRNKDLIIVTVCCGLVVTVIGGLIVDIVFKF